MQIRLVLTCEHAVNFVPPAYRPYFLSPEAHQALQGHRGYDPGARKLFAELKDRADFAAAGEMSRLLIDLNRSVHHRRLFSEFSRLLPQEERDALLRNYYEPFRSRVREAIHDLTQTGTFVLHLSIHTFTPVLGQNESALIRKTGIGILYDPSRRSERPFADAFIRDLQAVLPTVHGQSVAVHRNQPYRGISDGHTTALRKSFPEREYAGLEIEVRQDIVRLKNVRSAVREIVRRIQTDDYINLDLL